MFSTLKNPALVKIYAIPLMQSSVGSMSWAISILYALELGASTLQVNLITTMRSTMGILLLVPFGFLSDRFGRRPMIVYPRIVMIVGTLMRAFATDPNHLILASLVGGFAGGSYFPILLSMIADIAKPEEQQASISTLFFCSSIGMVLGPSIATFLLTIPQITLRSIYQITAIAQAGVLVYLFTQIRETKPQANENAKFQVLPHIKDLIRRESFQALLGVMFLYFFNYSIVTTYLPIHGRVNLTLSNAEVTSFSFYRSLGILLIRFSTAAFLTRVSIRPFFILVLALGGVAGLLSPYANSYPAIVLTFFLAGVSFGAVRILSTTIVAKNATPENRGTANGLLDIGQSAGNFTKILTSSMADSVGLTPVFVLGGTVGLATVIPVVLRRVGS